jgi:hypothetical protein
LVFFKKKVDSGDPVKTQNLGLGPGQLLGVIIFCSIRFLSKKIIKQKFFIKKKPRAVQTDQFQFGLVFLDKNWFKSVWLGFFSGLDQFFPVWLDFFSDFFGLGSVFSVSSL